VKEEEGMKYRVKTQNISPTKKGYRKGSFGCDGVTAESSYYGRLMLMLAPRSKNKSALRLVSTGKEVLDSGR